MKNRRHHRKSGLVLLAWLVAILGFVVVANPILIDVQAAKGG